MYATQNEGKSGISGRFIRTLNNKIDKYMTPILENEYIDKLDDTVNKYDEIYHSAIRIKPAYVKQNIYTLLKKLIKKNLNLNLVILWYC